MTIRVKRVDTEDFGEIEVSDENFEGYEDFADYFTFDNMGELLYGCFGDKHIEEIVEYKNKEGKWVEL